MRKMNRANDYITRAECQALIVHTLNDFLAQMAADAPVEPEAPTVDAGTVVPVEPQPAVS